MSQTNMINRYIGTLFKQDDYFYFIQHLFRHILLICFIHFIYFVRGRKIKFLKLM